MLQLDLFDDDDKTLIIEPTVAYPRKKTVQQPAHKLIGDKMIKTIVVTETNMKVFHGNTRHILRGHRIHQKHGVRHASITKPNPPNEAEKGYISQII